jgi:hypothetical protein
VTQPTEQYDAAGAVSAFRQAAALNLEDPLLDGSTLRLPRYGQVVMTGDLHGHRKNMEKLRKYAMLDRVAARHVILHEMVHADPLYPTDVDHSHEVLLNAACYKCDHPEQVHFLQSNHELAQLTNYPIAKAGAAVVDRFDLAVAGAYGRARAAEVLSAIDDFIASFPLAAVTETGVWMSHSLPNTFDMHEFDPEVFKRRISREELPTNRTIFNLVWGRHHNQAHIDRLAEMLGVEVFITGHQPQEMGYDFQFGRLIILASDHNHGSFLPFDLSKKHTAEQLIRNIRKFVAVA